MLSGGDRVHHYRKVSTRGILHSYGYSKSAGSKSVLLIFNRASAYGNVGYKIGEISVVFGIKHLVGAGKSRFGKGSHMKFSDGNHTLEHIGIFGGNRLMKHSLISVSRGSWLVGIYSGDDQYLIGNLILNGAKS